MNEELQWASDWSEGEIWWGKWGSRLQLPRRRAQWILRKRTTERKSLAERTKNSNPGPVDNKGDGEIPGQKAGGEQWMMTYSSWRGCNLWLLVPRPALVNEPRVLLSISDLFLNGPRSTQLWRLVPGPAVTYRPLSRLLYQKKLAATEHGRRN